MEMSAQRYERKKARPTEIGDETDFKHLLSLPAGFSTWRKKVIIKTIFQGRGRGDQTRPAFF